jgi:hypothetical protein
MESGEWRVVNGERGTVNLETPRLVASSTCHLSFLPSAFLLLPSHRSRRLITGRIYPQVAKSDRLKRFPDLSF